MSILGKGGRVLGGVMTGGMTEVLGVGDDIEGFVDDPSGAKGAEERLGNYQGQSAAERARAKAKQYELLGQLKAPTVSDSVKNRIKALEGESKAGPLVEDPYFQKQRATLVQGGQQALSSVQNTQAAQGNSGGFSNQGSVNDIYDRLGSQLAGLGQESANLKDQKAETAAQMQQSIIDAQIDYENSITNAKIAIESGDAAAASAALDRAYNAQEMIKQNQRNFNMSLVTTGIGLAAGGMGGGAAAAPRAVAPASAPAANYGAVPYTSPSFSSDLMNMNSGGYNSTITKPWYATR